MMSGLITFYVVGAIIVIFALLVVTSRNTVHSILYLWRTSWPWPCSTRR